MSRLILTMGLIFIPAVVLAQSMHPPDPNKMCDVVLTASRAMMVPTSSGGTTTVTQPAGTILGQASCGAAPAGMELKPLSGLPVGSVVTP
jgi:hypothetical protein